MANIKHFALGLSILSLGLCSYAHAFTMDDLCDKGDGRACFELGSVYAKGSAYQAVDFEKAADYFKRGCEKNDGQSCAAIASYYDVFDVNPEPILTLRFLDKACKLGIAKSCTQLYKSFWPIASIQPPSELDEIAINAGRQACQDGEAEACRFLGDIYGLGRSVPQNFERSKDWFDKGCALKDGVSCAMAADLMHNGQITSLPPEKKFDYLDKSCTYGVAAPCLFLAVSYRDGIGVPEDKTKFKEYLEKGCQLGDRVTCRTLGYLYHRENNPQKSLTHYQRACDLHDGDACLDLGILFATGDGVALDQATSYKLFLKACDLGKGQACFNAAIQLDKTTGYGQDEKLYALELLNKACSLHYDKACASAEAFRRKLDSLNGLPF